MNRNTTALKISAFCSLGLAFVFGLFSLVFYYADWHRLLLVSLLGFFLGLMAAPELQPKAFKRAGLLQVSSGFSAGMVFGYWFQLQPETIWLAALSGAFLGWLAPLWIKYLSIP
ncbi:MAG: hypothetical protein KZQ58_12665 [gamma proteobacterium symbiont of Bathyaustriella thionipta]|nr:hypothetical protein [gamma proteobacterium symbiont of Bathyaustriella thionipta]